MFLSLVRPDRISSPITRMAAVMTSPLAPVFCAPDVSFIGLLPEPSAVARRPLLLKPTASPNRHFYGLFRRRCRAVTGIAITAGGRRGSMTYCCGILVRDGLVMIADTRTNAGLDNVSTFRKLHVFSNPGERIMAIASAGNLAISQSVLSTLTEGLEDRDTCELETLMNAPTMFQAAQRIGRAIRNVHATEGEALRSEDVSFDVSFLFGGQIKGSKMRLFMVYTAGNFIECTTDTHSLQIGEHKYGKPVLDRAMQ